MFKADSPPPPQDGASNYNTVVTFLSIPFARKIATPGIHRLHPKTPRLWSTRAQKLWMTQWISETRVLETRILEKCQKWRLLPPRLGYGHIGAAEAAPSAALPLVPTPLSPPLRRGVAPGTHPGCSRDRDHDHFETTPSLVDKGCGDTGLADDDEVVVVSAGRAEQGDSDKVLSRIAANQVSHTVESTRMQSCSPSLSHDVVRAGVRVSSSGAGVRNHEASVQTSTPESVKMPISRLSSGKTVFAVEPGRSTN